MSEAKKEVIYIDAEDEITAVIEKVVTSKPKIVAVVLPKHATVFQSSVNMKLLGKAALNAKKNLVLITSDKSIVAIALAAKVMVARTPTSKPEVPAIKKSNKAEDDATGPKTIPVPADDKVASIASKKDDTSRLDEINEDSIELDNTEDSVTEVKTEVKTKKLVKIPDFSSFKIRMFLAVFAITLIGVLWFIGFVVMPKATIIVNSDISTNNVNTTFTARVGEGVELDIENRVLPASRVQVEKIDTATVPATGEKNIGERATGSMNLTNCIKSDGVQVVPAGTRFSASGITFETTEQVILPEATFSFSGTCKSKENGDDKTVGVVSIEPGAESNISSQSYNSSISGIIASGSAMTGGTTEIVKVISDEDVDNAATTLSGASRGEALEELRQLLNEEGLRSVEETFIEGTPEVLASPAVDTEASEVKITRTVTFSLIGVSDGDLAELLEAKVRENLGESQQNIRDNGSEGIKFQVLDRPDEAQIKLSIETVATIGPDIDIESLKNEIIGKKRGEIEKLIEKSDGVKSVSVEYSPVWITTTPKSAEKIDIIFNDDND